jgi:hypothetical protein
MPDEMYFTNEELEAMPPEFSKHLLESAGKMYPDREVVSGKEWLRGGSKSREARQQDRTERDDRLDKFRDDLVKKYDLAGYLTNPDIMSLVSTLFEPEEGSTRTLVTNNEILRKVFQLEKEEQGLENVECRTYNDIITTGQNNMDPDSQLGVSPYIGKDNANVMRDKLQELEEERAETTYPEFDKEMKDQGKKIFVSPFQPYKDKEYEKAERKQPAPFVSAEFRAAKQEAQGMDQQRGGFMKDVSKAFSKAGKWINKQFGKVFGKKKQRGGPEMDM